MLLFPVFIIPQLYFVTTRHSQCHPVLQLDFTNTASLIHCLFRTCCACGTGRPDIWSIGTKQHGVVPPRTVWHSDCMFLYIDLRCVESFTSQICCTHEARWTDVKDYSPSFRTRVWIVRQQERNNSLWCAHTYVHCNCEQLSASRAVPCCIPPAASDAL
jgi:hypothetical protein